jgi:hypothetical protein
MYTNNGRSKKDYAGVTSRVEEDTENTGIADSNAVRQSAIST